MNLYNKTALLEGGVVRQANFCTLNGIACPPVTRQSPENWLFGTCAYYRPDRGTVICPEKCAATTRGFGQAWSFPGYFIDRTPFGVVQHELGHHVDCQMATAGQRGAYFSDFSVRLRQDSGEAKITNYCPNDAEWFAELFRVFVTNPDLLRLMRPRTHELFMRHWKPVETRPWAEVMAGAPQRNFDQVEKRIQSQK